jgi:hypothetical protein
VFKLQGGRKTWGNGGKNPLRTHAYPKNRISYQFGGLAMFGPVGVITGPVIMAFFISITEIYSMELKVHLGGTDKI